MIDQTIYVFQNKFINLKLFFLKCTYARKCIFFVYSKTNCQKHFLNLKHRQLFKLSLISANLRKFTFRMFKVSQQVLLTTRLHRFLSTPLLSNELISFLKQNACSFFFVNTTRDKVGTTVFIVFNFQVYYRIFLLLVEYPSGSCHPFFSESFSLLFFAFHLTWNTRNDIPIS